MTRHQGGMYEACEARIVNVDDFESRSNFRHANNAPLTLRER
jgi:hypothetical protein